MDTVPSNAIVVFLRGPNDGFIEVGDRALPFVMHIEVPKAGEPGSRPGESSPIKGKRAEIGQKWRDMPMYFMDAAQKFPRPRLWRSWVNTANCRTSLTTH